MVCGRRQDLAHGEGFAPLRGLGLDAVDGSDAFVVPLVLEGVRSGATISQEAPQQGAEALRQGLTPERGGLGGALRRAD